MKNLLVTLFQYILISSILLFCKMVVDGIFHQDFTSVSSIFLILIAAMALVENMRKEVE